VRLSRCQVPSDLTTEFPVVQVFAPSAPSDYGPPSTVEEEDQEDEEEVEVEEEVVEEGPPLVPPAAV
jgi:hypothetical protein